MDEVDLRYVGSKVKCGDSGVHLQPDVSAVAALRAVAKIVFRGAPPLPIHFWDGTSLQGPGPERLRITSPEVLRELLWAPGELGLARSYVKGYIQIDGDLNLAIKKMRDGRVIRGASYRDLVGSTVRLIFGLQRLLWGLSRERPDPPPEEFRSVGCTHSRRRDAAAIAHHYDLGNEFYALLLGKSMTYTCGNFRGVRTLEEAQAMKLELVASKLALGEGEPKTLLDVGCGWGSMALYAACQYGTKVTAITNSAAQAEWASASVQKAGLGALVQVKVTDYRDLPTGQTFDAISSIGMSEAVGRKRLASYVTKLASHLRPGGRVLNHAISGRWAKPGSRSFAHRYIFPDGDVVPVETMIRHMEAARLRVIHVEAIGEHYTPTLQAWLRNLEENWDEAVDLIGTRRARAWRLYLAGASNTFAEGRLDVHQVVGVRS